MSMLRMENWDSTKISHASGKYIDAVADPGEGPGGAPPPPLPPLFLDESEVRRAEKNFFLDIVPPPRPPPPLPYLKVWIRHWDVQDSGKNLPIGPSMVSSWKFRKPCTVSIKFIINGF